jgi:hypothetical protein
MICKTALMKKSNSYDNKSILQIGVPKWIFTFNIIRLMYNIFSLDISSELQSTILSQISNYSLQKTVLLFIYSIRLKLLLWCLQKYRFYDNQLPSI